ncbi:MAG: MATE family efflux transporter, partial [Floccifex sp.]
MNNKMATMEMKKLILTMAFPIMISMLVQALYNIVDSIFIAHISQNALTAISLAFPIQTIMVAVACGTAVGINTLISRYLGEKREKEALQVALHGIVLSLVNGFVFALFGIFGIQWFLEFFTDNFEIIALGQSYLKICLFFSFSIFIQITR